MQMSYSFAGKYRLQPGICLEQESQGSWFSRLFVCTMLLHPNDVTGLMSNAHPGWVPQANIHCPMVAQANVSVFLQPGSYSHRAGGKEKMLLTGVWGQTPTAFTVCWHTLGSWMGRSTDNTDMFARFLSMQCGIRARSWNMRQRCLGRTITAATVTADREWIWLPLRKKDGRGCLEQH